MNIQTKSILTIVGMGLALLVSTSAWAAPLKPISVKIKSNATNSVVGGQEIRVAIQLNHKGNANIKLSSDNRNLDQS